MLFLLKVKMDTEKANDAARKGTMSSLIQEILKETKPEAAYFLAEDGKRTGYLFVNMEETSQIPELAEPWFLTFGAGIEIQPVMRPEDLDKAGTAMAAAVEKYG